MINLELAKRFNESFEYRDGNLYWKINPNKSRKHVGKLAGYKTNSTSYGVVMLDKKSYCLHRVIYCMFHGDVPVVVDHINGDYKDHRIENLRAADHCTNNYNKQTQTNNKLGVKNVCWSKVHKKYLVQITKDRKNVFSKFFDDLELADLCAHMAREKYHGEFANHGGK